MQRTLGVEITERVNRLKYSLAPFFPPPSHSILYFAADKNQIIESRRTPITKLHVW